MGPAEQFLSKSRELIDVVALQLPQVRIVAGWFAQTILAGGWCMCLRVVTAGSWSKRCGRAMDHFRVLIRSSNSV